jgi:hypothetical protein
VSRLPPPDLLEGVSKVSDRAFLISMFWKGPWERAAERLWAITAEGEITRVVPEGSLRDQLASWCDYRDRIWSYKHALCGRPPHPRWIRP